MRPILLAAILSTASTRVAERAFTTTLESCEHAGNKTECVDRAMLQLASLPSAGEVIKYFYGAHNPAERMRLATCNEKPIPRGGQHYQNDMIWSAKPGATSPCLWGNMPFGKSIAIMQLARALKVTHIIESGRMGGISLTHYHAFKFGLVSVELYPVPTVSAALRQLYPSIKLADCDGMVLVPEALANISRATGYSTPPRIAVILDGPKGKSALQLARRLAPYVVFVGCDDMTVDPLVEWPGRLATHTASAWWRAAFPLERDLQYTMQSPEDKMYHNSKDDMMLLEDKGGQPRRRIRTRDGRDWSARCEGEEEEGCCAALAFNSHKTCEKVGQ